MQFLCHLPQFPSERSKLVLPAVPARLLENLTELIATGRD
jgi:hypothetical protein